MKKYWKWLLFIPVVLIICIVGYFLFTIYMLSGASGHVDVKESFKEYYEVRKRLVYLVETWQLEYKDDGLLIDLDRVEELEEFPENEKVYVRYSEEKVIIEFVINSGMPDDGQSLFYSSGGEDLIREKTNENLYAKIEKLEDNWYFVQYN